MLQLKRERVRQAARRSRRRILIGEPDAAPAQPLATPEEVFRVVFRSVVFPFLAIDVDRLASELQGHPHGELCWCKMRLRGEGNRRSASLGAWRGLLQMLDVPLPARLATARALAKATGDSIERTLARIDNPEHPYFSVTSQGDELIWQENTIWPIAYSTALVQLDTLVGAYESIYAQKREQIRQGYKQAGFDLNPDFLDHYTRVMPTTVHYAAASLGAWLGGSKNVQFFGQYAIEPQLNNKDYALKCARSMGFSEDEASALNDGGLVAVPPTIALPLMQTQGSTEVFGGIALNEANINHLDQDHFDLEQQDKATPRPGILFDKHYRAPFIGRPLSAYAVHGGKNVLRDHYDDFYKAHAGAELVRCKHYVAPVIDIETQEDAQSIVADIPIRDAKNGIFFRGQTSFHALGRPPLIRQFLFGDSCSTEPSLPSAASRVRFNYDAFHFALRHYLENYCFAFHKKRKAGKARKWRQRLCKPSLSIDYALMALAQHYGVPTHGLDVTTDLDVALWFATNKYDSTGPLTRYQALSSNDWVENKSKWPVIFVCQVVTHSLAASLHDCAELDDFDLKPLRPLRQKARFFLGGHSDQQNRMAESVVCVLRLNPGSYPVGISFDALFPAPEVDRAYAAMLKFRTDRYFTWAGTERINQFHDWAAGAEL